jgi:nicotinamide-nucleotide amidase
VTETLSDILPDRVEHAARALLEQACEANLSFVTAESCTGGLLASLLTDVEGVSRAFERGFVVYSEIAKCELLGVPQAEIDRYGAVSRQVAMTMARGALAASHAQIALSVTGFAGAAGEHDEPGLVHFACYRTGRPPVHREEHFGNIGRGPVRVASLEVALEMMLAAL